MAAVDNILDDVKTSYALSASQTIIAQWNQNKYYQPRIYGTYKSNSTTIDPINYSVNKSLGTGSVSVTMTGSTPVSVTNVSSTFNTTAQSNAFRLMFDAQISSISTSINEDISEFMLVITPKLGAVELTDFESCYPVSMVEKVYQKQELFFCSNVDSTQYFDSFNISIYPINDLNGYPVVVNFKNISAAALDINDISNYQQDNLQNIFETYRPGDQILENNAITASINPISKYYVATEIFSDTVRTPILFPTYVSPYNENIYYISPTRGNYSYQNIYVDYDATILTNQIYIKTQNFNIPVTSITGRNTRNVTSYLSTKNSEFYVYLKVAGVWQSTPIYSESGGTLSSTGAIVLQYNPTTGLWSEGYDDSSLPQINATTGSYTAQPKSIEGIKIVGNASRLRMIEISPRLALDLSNYLISSKVSTSIDEGNYPIPVGKIDSNDGSIEFENLPRLNGSTYYQIFDNLGLSPLAGKVKSDIKFTIYSTITNTKTNVSNKIKTATMYSKSWTLNGFETATVELSDYSYYLQNRSAPDLLLVKEHQPRHSGNFKMIVEAFLQLSGFSDYDSTSLQTISDKLQNKRVTTPIFYCSKERKIWEVLSELLLGYQVSAYFNENGILKFKDILRETAANGSYSDNSRFPITNTSSGTTLANIISFSQKEIEDVGSIEMSYRQLSPTNNVLTVNGTQDLNQTNTMTGAKYGIKESNYSNLPWQASDSGEALLTCINITAPFLKKDNTISTGNFTQDISVTSNKIDPRAITGFKGYGIVEGEVISWDGLQYTFTPDLSSYDPTLKTVQTIRSSEELADEISKRLVAATNVNGTQGPDISFRLTGKLMNVQRGLFGTSAADHISTVKTDPNAFTGIALPATGKPSSAMTLGYRFQRVVDAENDQSYTIGVPQAPYIRYLGFYQKDNSKYTRYRVVFKSVSVLDGFGMFFGAPMNYSAGTVNFDTTPTGHGKGIFIRLYPKSANSEYSAEVRYGTSAANDSNVIARSNQGFLNEGKTITYKMVNVKLTPAQAAALEKTNPEKVITIGVNKYKKVKKTIVHPPKTNVVDVIFNVQNQTVSVVVNGKPIKFFTKNNQSNLPKYFTYSGSQFRRNERSFGIFTFSDKSKAQIKIKEILAGTNGQVIDHDISMAEAGVQDFNISNLIETRTKIRRDSTRLTGLFNPVRPFSLRAEPLLKGLAIIETKYEGDTPYFALDTWAPFGAVEAQIIPENSVKSSIVIGTPFRGRAVFMNTMKRIAPLFSNSSNYKAAAISGHAIINNGDRSLKRQLDDVAGMQEIKISSPWTKNEGVAENLILDLTKNMKSMNYICNVEVFGNPALRVGDYVDVTYLEKGITAKKFVIISTDNNFSEGGITTSLMLRSVSSIL